MVSGMKCRECETEMEYISFYHYETKYGRLITGDVFHCPNCGEDDVIERRWEFIDEERKKYWHG